MDVLSDILEKIKLSSAVYFESNFSAPWGMDVPRGPFAQFHIVTGGSCVLKFLDQTVSLSTGDVIVFPAGTEHWLADDPNSARKAGAEVVTAIMKGASLFSGADVATTLVCGHFEFDRSLDHPFLNELPDVIHIKSDEGNDFPMLQSVCELIIQETQKQFEGSQTIINKLGEILFIQALRVYLNRRKADQGFLVAIQDERIGRAIKVIHESPETDWQLTSLAQVAGMSRTSFSNHFKLLMGITPLKYVTQWRILRAKELLNQTQMAVGEIAHEVGYQSEAAFNRVFKKRENATPLKYRQSVQV